MLWTDGRVARENAAGDLVHATRRKGLSCQGGMEAVRPSAAQLRGWRVAARPAPVVSVRARGEHPYACWQMARTQSGATPSTRFWVLFFQPLCIPAWPLQQTLARLRYFWAETNRGTSGLSQLVFPSRWSPNRQSTQADYSSETGFIALLGKLNDALRRCPSRSREGEASVVGAKRPALHLSPPLSARVGAPDADEADPGTGLPSAVDEPSASCSAEGSSRGTGREDAAAPCPSSTAAGERLQSLDLCQGPARSLGHCRWAPRSALRAPEACDVAGGHHW